jgi:hypothetical protein
MKTIAQFPELRDRGDREAVNKKYPEENHIFICLMNQICGDERDYLDSVYPSSQNSKRISDTLRKLLDRNRDSDSICSLVTPGASMILEKLGSIAFP